VTALPSPIRARGKGTIRWTQWRARQRALVALRCSGICEVSDCKEKAGDWHHVWGRGHILSEPLASHHTATVGLCRRHHNATTRGEKPITPYLQLLSIGRMCAWFKLPQMMPDQVRTIEAIMRAEGDWEKLCTEAGRHT
jgi:hypothetical protein